MGAASNVKTLLADPSIFRGNKTNQLKTAVDELRAKLGKLVEEDRIKAIGSIRSRGLEIQQTEYFQSATPDAKQQALGDIDAEVVALNRESSIAKLRLAPQAFATATLPRLLQELATSNELTPVATGEPGVNTAQTGGDQSSQPMSVPLFISIDAIQVAGGQQVLSTDADVNEYIESLRSALTNAINAGKRITL
jgi:hypothetical protein